MSSPDVLTDTHLLLLCRDYLIDLRRNNDETVLTEKNLDPDYISLAIFSLNQSILRPDYLTDGRKRDDIFSSFSKTSGSHRIPNISKINKEILSPRAISHALMIKTTTIFILPTSIDFIAKMDLGVLQRTVH